VEKIKRKRLKNVKKRDLDKKTFIVYMM